MGQNKFSGRLSEKPDENYLENLRGPEYEMMAEWFVEPLMICNNAHVIVLHENDIIDPESARALANALAVVEQMDREQFQDYEQFEDPYFQMEAKIIDEAGEDIGGELHTGRSRNDLFAAVVRIVIREQLLSVVDATLDLRRTILDRAAATDETVMPGYTHSQPAQPITLGHYLCAFDHVLERDVARLKQAYRRTNRSPLGAAALGGTGFELDRERLAELAGFDGICENTYEAVAAMDYVPEAASSLASLMTNTSRLSRDLTEWSTYEFGFIEIDDSFATVSSIMPQKKNAVVLEKIRTEASNTIGAATSSLTHRKAAPFGDVREVSKYAFMPLLEHVEDVRRTLALLSGVVETMTVNEQRMYDSAASSFCTATELADTIVRETDLPFRDAHEVVGTFVKAAHADGRTSTEVTIEDLQEAARATLGHSIDLDAEAFEDALDPETNVTRRRVAGGTSPDEVRADITALRQSVEDQNQWVTDARNRLENASVKRNDRIEALGN